MDLKTFGLFLFRVAPELKSPSSFQKSSDWTLDHGYDHYDPNDADDYPYRYFDSFDNFGVSAYLKTLDRDIDYLCNGEFYGYSITLHLPNEIPSIRKNKSLLASVSNFIAFYNEQNKIVKKLPVFQKAISM